MGALSHCTAPLDHGVLPRLSTPTVHRDTAPVYRYPIPRLTQRRYTATGHRDGTRQRHSACVFRDCTLLSGMGGQAPAQRDTQRTAQLRVYRDPRTAALHRHPPPPPRVGLRASGPFRLPSSPPPPGRGLPLWLWSGTALAHPRRRGDSPGRARDIAHRVAARVRWLTGVASAIFLSNDTSDWICCDVFILRYLEPPF